MTLSYRLEKCLLTNTKPSPAGVVVSVPTVAGKDEGDWIS